MRSEVVELDVAQAQRGRDVARPAVDTDDGASGREAVDEGADVHRRPHRGRRPERIGDAHRALGLGTARARQRDRPAVGDQAPAERDPARLGPELVVARRAVDEDDRARAGRVMRLRTGKAERRRPSRRRAERTRDELAPPIERVAVRLDPDRMRGEPARRPFVARAFGAVGEREGRAARQTRDQRGLRQTLKIDDSVVRLAPQARDERLRLGADGCLPPAGPRPAAQVALDHLVDAVDPAQQGRERRLDHPVDVRIGTRRADVGDHGQRVDDVAERRQLDDQDAHGAGLRRARRRCLNAPPPGPARRA